MRIGRVDPGGHRQHGSDRIRELSPRAIRFRSRCRTAAHDGDDESAAGRADDRKQDSGDEDPCGGWPDDGDGYTEGEPGTDETGEYGEGFEAGSCECAPIGCECQRVCVS
jgi:hypothetical protein